MNLAAFPKLTVQQMISRCTQLPVCPALFTRLTSALQNPNQNICDLADIVSADPVLTARVLRTANGAYYGLSQSVRSVDDAIIRLGFEEIFSIAAASRAKELFTSLEKWAGLGERMWSHSVCAAVFARTLARKAVQRRLEDAYYTVALLHDFGKLLFAQIDPEYTALSERGAVYGADLNERERQRYGATHAEAGGELLRQWRLPKLLVAAVENHHQPISETAVPDSWVLIVAAADFLAHKSAVKTSDAQPAPELPPAIARHLKIRPGELPGIIADSLRQAAMLETV